MNIFISGLQGTGKTTLINRLLADSRRAVYGFVTRKRVDSEGMGFVYISHATGGEKYLVAKTTGTGFTDYPEVFDSCGVEFLNVPDGSLVVMDELGFLENRAELFKKQVLSLLDRNVTIIGAIKPRSTPFLDAVRSHSSVTTISLTADTRESAYEEAHKLLFTL